MVAAFSVEAMVRGYHASGQRSVVGEEFQCQRESGN